jgi:hypothetical protein
MRGDDAFAVLGLRPGAGRDEIDQAYRRLIKQYHPDYAGGDANKAAEINRAYTDLRARPRAAVRAAPRPAPVPREMYARPQSSWRTPLVVAAAAAAFAMVAASATMSQNDPWADVFTTDDAGGASDSRGDREALRAGGFDEPLAAQIIQSSVGNARRLKETNDPALAAEFSRECLSRLSSNPSVPLFDSCAAYDEAIALLSTGDPAFESGPFNPLAVTARQVGAARMLSADDFEAESRLQQIRSQVHMALLPAIPDASRASVERVSTRVPAPRRERAQRTAARTIRYRPEVPVTVTPVAAEPPRAIKPVSAPRPRRSKPPEKPAPKRASAEPGTKPAWQQPLKPAWQRPLPARER